jgi:hypothetical protein
MVIFDILFVVIVFMVAIGFATQVVVPFFQGTQYFPWFRASAIHKEVVNVEHALEETAEAEILKAKQTELAARSAKLKE